MMNPKTSPIVQRLTIAALLGTLPRVTEAQGPRAASTSSRSASEGGSAEELTPDSIRIAARPIARGATLTAEDIAYERRVNPAGHATPHSVAVVEMAHRPATTNDSLVGWTARRMINTGEPLRAPAVISPRIVASGETVDVIWRDGSIVVTAKGHATRAAGAGERVAVRIDSQRMVEGLVVAPGKVRVD
jgi:flagella basal body P-ring formation protein FlgA